MVLYPQGAQVSRVESFGPKLIGCWYYTNFKEISKELIGLNLSTTYQKTI